MCRHLGWLVNIEKSELEPKQVFNFVGYQFDLESGRLRPTPDRWQSLQGKILELISLPACSVREFMSLMGLLTATEKQVHLGRLHMRPIQWHLKSNWRIPESLEKRIPPTQISTSSLAMVAKRRQCPHRPTITPHSACTANLYRRIKRRVGHSLKRVHCQRNLVPTGKQVTYKLPRTQSSFSSFKRVPKPMRGQNGSDSNRQHHGSVLHQQGRRHKVRPTVCVTLENLDLVHRETSNPCTHLPVFFPRTSWPKRVWTARLQWSYQPWPQLWINPSSLIGPSVRSERCATIWTGPQTSGRIKNWSLSPSRKVSTRTSHLPLSPHGSNRL